jgi:hypothetical protein
MENYNNTSNEGTGSIPPRPGFPTKPAPLPPPRSLLPPPTPPKKNGNNIPYFIAIGVLVVALLGSFWYIHKLNRENAENLAVAEEEKQEVIADLEQLKTDYGVLKAGNDTLNAQLDSERKKIDGLMDKLKKTEASNRAKMRQYEREIGNLKSLLTGYVHQIDSLSALTRTLKAENTRYRTELDQSKKQVEQYTQETTALKSMVEKGGEVKTRGVNAAALGKKDKVVNRANKTEQIRVCLTLLANDIAKRGTRTVYVRIKSPDGSLLTQSITNLFDPASGGPQLIYSDKREVNYNGEDLDVCVYYKDTEFMSGFYSIEVYLDGASVGSTQLELK